MPASPSQARVDAPVTWVSVLSQMSNPTRLLRAWNWKSATVSASIRAAIFFVANLQGGREAAWAAWSTEFVLRLATSGFYGGLTQEFSAIEPEWHGMLAAMVVLPVLSHALEIIVHLMRGTSELVVSIAASMAFTVLSTTFNVFAMRRGALVTGNGSRPLHRDLLLMPGLVAAFARSGWRAANAVVAKSTAATDRRRRA